MLGLKRIQTIKVDYMQLANIFDKLLLVQEYRSLWDEFSKKLRSHYWGAIINTPDEKYTFFMSATNVYLFPFTKKYIWIRDNTQNVAYELDKPTQYKNFKKYAFNAVLNKTVGMPQEVLQNNTQNTQS